jgi:hypothetical protein
MNIPFDIVTGKGPLIENPIRTMEVGAMLMRPMAYDGLDGL